MSKIDAKDRIGEKRTMNCGLEAEIIEYFNNKNITLRFEDGCIVKNKRYKNFKQGYIAHPSINVLKNKHDKRVEERLGITRMMNCGMNATIIAYRNSHDIDVEFEDHIVVRNKMYQSFKNGHIAHPSHS